MPVVLGITALWFMGMMNTVNWLDGLDGLATGVGEFELPAASQVSLALDRALELCFKTDS